MQIEGYGYFVYTIQLETTWMAIGAIHDTLSITS